MPTAHWEETSLQELIPEPIVALVTGVSVIQGAITTLNAVQVAAAALIPPTTAALSAAAGVAAASSALASAAAALIGDLRQTGIHLLIVPPSAGGSQHLQEHLRICLLDEGNPERPNFSPNTYLTVFGLITDSEDAGTVLENFNKVLAVFASTKAAHDFLVGPGFESAVRAVEETSAKEVLTFVEHFFKGQLTNTARPLARCLWRSESVEDLLPEEAQKALRDSQRILEGVAAWGASDPFVAYLQFLQRILDELVAQITALVDTLTAMENLFADVEIRTLTIPPFQGGNQSLADALPTIFGPESSFEATTNSAIVGGVIVLAGTVTEADARAINDLFRALFEG